MGVKVPAGFTECEEYRGYIIAVRGAFYCGFGVEDDTRNYQTRVEVRRAIDRMLSAAK